MMLFWIILAGMTALVLAIVVYPVMRSAGPAAGRASYDLQIYRDQLAELERDKLVGLIDDRAAEAARNELARRILAAEDQTRQAASAARAASPIWASAAALVTIPAVALTGYLLVGRPDLPDQPRAERIAKAVETGDLVAMIAQVESHLAANPNDAKGWLVIAPAYRRLGRFNDAAEAFRKGIALSPPDANVMTEYGETLVLTNNGMITAQAREIFDKALVLDPAWPKARFYRAMADNQDGNKQQALQRFRALLTDAPKDAPWRSAVERQIAELSPSGKGPALDKETVDSAQQMTADERQKMIAGMVDRLAKRLAGDGDDLDGWLRLINARIVLGQQDEAQAAFKKARLQFKDNQQALSQLADIGRRHGLKETE
ncbi:MAG: c-type cytochrome biogenesis protein CcmI [Aestuariivirgaceae bacterium]